MNNAGNGNSHSYSTASALHAASQLEQLAKVTTLSIDSGDLKVIEKYAQTGFITDATTNPLFVSQAGLSGDPIYAKLVDDAVQFAISANEENEESTLALAIDRLAVNLGSSIASIVKGYISTEARNNLKIIVVMLGIPVKTRTKYLHSYIFSFIATTSSNR